MWTLSKRGHRLSSAVALVVLWSCTDPAESSGGPAVGERSGQVREVANREADGWRDSQPWTLVEELRLGTLDGPASQHFVSVGSVIADADAIYVLDSGAQEIKVFAPDGTFLHRIGRRGDGPGEFAGVGGMAFSPDETLWVADYRASRYSLFGKDGSPRATLPRQIFGVVYPWPGRFRADGGLLDMDVVRLPGEREDQRRLVLDVLHVSPNDGTVLDTVAQIVQAYPVAPRGTRPRTPHGPRPRAVIDAVAGVMWIATSTEYLIHRVSLPADTTLSFSLDSRPVSITPRERDSILERRPGVYDRRDVPDAKEIICAIFSDDSHVFVVPEIRSDGHRRTLDVFTHEGRFVGRALSPVPLQSYARNGPPFVHGNLLYVIWADDAGVEQVSRLRMVGPRRPIDTGAQS